MSWLAAWIGASIVSGPVIGRFLRGRTRPAGEDAR